jgi:hypothetical protein
MFVSQHNAGIADADLGMVYLTAGIVEGIASLAPSAFL